MYLVGTSSLSLSRIANRKATWESADRSSRKGKGAPPPPQKPEGAGKMRTPTSAYDPAAGKDVYEPEKSLASASAKAPLVADGAAGGSNDPMPAPPKPGVPESAPLPDPPEPLTKKRKVSLSSLVGGKIKKEVVATLPTAFDELEAYLAEADEEDFDIKLLTWWHAKETKWPNLAKPCQDGQAVPFRPRLLRSPLALSASFRQRATCMVTCRSRPRTPRWNTPSLPRSTLTEL